MKLPPPRMPYRSSWRQRLVDLLIVIGVGVVAALAGALVLSASSETAQGQQIYLAQPWPAWYANGTYCDANGRCVPNWQMPRPAIAQNQPVPFDRLQPAPSTPTPATAPKSVYAGPLPPRDEPAATPAPKPPATPAPANISPATPATAVLPQANQTGDPGQTLWAPAQLSTTIVYPPAAANSPNFPANPDLARAIVKVDGRARRRADELELAIATQNEKLYRALADVPAAVSHAAASDRLAIVGALEKLPAATQTAVAAGLKGMAETVAVRHVDNSSYTEMLAQILLVASGSAASVGTGYWLYKLAAIAAAKLLKRAIASHLKRSAETPAPALRRRKRKAIHPDRSGPGGPEAEPRFP